MQDNIKSVCDLPSLWDDASTIYSEYNNTTGFTSYFSGIASNIEFGNNPDINKEYRILDVGCGTGGTSCEIIKCLLKNNLKASICSIDFSRDMLKKCNENIAALGLTKDCGVSIETFQMDGHNLTFQDNQFDVAFSMFGLSFFSDKKRGLAEIYRCLKPGSSVYLCGWEPNCVHEGGLKKWGEAINGSMDGLNRSTFGTVQEFSEFLQGGGFKDVVIEKTIHSKTISTEDTARFFSISPVVIDMSKDKTNEWRYESFKKSFAESNPDGFIHAKSMAYIGHGRK